MKPCVAIAIYDHGHTIAGVVDSIASLGLPCLIVDDGSSKPTRDEIDRLAADHSWIEIARHPRNLGRGSALRTAYRNSARRGMTHVVQIDADGQHDAADIPKFLDAAKREPGALILGKPLFDASIPRSRLYGRQLSRAIAWIETLSMTVDDPLCGLRCIPLEPALRVLSRHSTGNRMDFDPEFVIRLVRAGVPVINIPTRVHYPKDGLSHFHMVHDNLRLARAYLRLALELPFRRSSDPNPRQDPS